MVLISIYFMGSLVILCISLYFLGPYQFILKTSATGTLFFITIYWLVSIFTYIVNDTKFSTYVTFNGRFFRRAYSLFWVIELFLFFIYIWLIMNSALELEWLADQTNLKPKSTPTNYINFLNLIIIGSILVLRAVMINYKDMIESFSFILVIFSLIIFIDELNQFVSVLSSTQGAVQDFFTTDSSWEISSEKCPLITYQYHFMLIEVLKLWHCALIVILSVSTCYRIVFDGLVMLSSLKFIFFNLIALYTFNNVFLMWCLKFFIQLLFFKPYVFFYFILLELIYWFIYLFI